MKKAIYLQLFITLLWANTGLAQKGEELVVYTSRNEHLIKGLFEQYEKETGTKIQYRTGEPGPLIQAIKAEGDNTPADLFITVDAGNLWFAKSEGLLLPLQSEVLNKNVPEHLRDPDNQWFGLSLRARTLVYNTSKLSEKDLASYEDLANPKWKGRVCLRTSKKVYNQSLVAMLIHHHGAKRAQEIVEGWVSNAVDIFSNDNAVMKAVAAGQCDVGIVNTYYYGRLMKEDASLPLKLYWPNQSDYGVHINVSGGGVLKKSKRPKQAQAFLEWLVSKPAQETFAGVNLEYPVVKDVPLNSQLESWGSFKSNTQFNLSRAGELQQEAIKLMHHAKYR